MNLLDSIAHIILVPFHSEQNSAGFGFFEVNVNECFEIPSCYESAGFDYYCPMRIKTKTFDICVDYEDEETAGEVCLVAGKYVYYKCENEYIVEELNFLTMQEQLEKIWKHYTPLLSSEIMQRGFMYCENCCHHDILITGMNPSWREKDKEEENHFRLGDILFNLEGDVYWSPVKKMLHSVERTLDYRGSAAYLDILYFREKEQDKIRKEILKDERGIRFVAEQLNLTQHTIEKIIKPKVIVVKNRTSAAYWGKEAKKGIIWMGYDFKFIKSHRCGEICRIEGLIDSSERIAPEITDTNLKGTIVLFAKHINQYIPKMERPEVEDIDELLELYKANNI